MKKIFLLIVLLISAAANAHNIDSLINLLYQEKTDSARICRFYEIYTLHGSVDPAKAIEIHQQILTLTKKHKDRLLEAIVSAELGELYNRAGATVQGASLIMDALKLAEATGDPQAMGVAYENLSATVHDPVKNKECHENALQYSTLAKDYQYMCWELNNIARFYTHPEHLQLDSALFYAEKGYQLAIAKKQSEPLVSALLMLSRVHQKLGNNGLALEYLRIAERLPQTQSSTQNLATVYYYFTRYYQEAGPADSAFFYAYKDLEYAKRSFFSNVSRSANSLRQLYAGKNADSALKYTNLYDAVKDSMLSIQALQQEQAMGFQETLRQEKLAEERLKAKEEHRYNLQYAAIAVGLVGFFILFLLFSRTIIANQKLISFLGVLSLLLVFEFLNLLLHPYLGELTDHSPILMLLIMVSIAAILVPFHHRIEHWTVRKLVEKNKKIRLAAAKKTIAELENEKDK